MRSDAMSDAWEPSTSIPVIGADQVHLWKMSLDCGSPDVERALTTLSDDERTRAARLRGDHLHRRFAIRRWMLRRVVAGYVGADPASLEFDTNAYGKPELAGGLSGRLSFSSSHSLDVGILGVSAGRRVGADVEHIDDKLDYMQIARRCFCPGEVSAIECLPPRQARREFFRLWTCKEAFVKALGRGLSFPPDRIEFACDDSSDRQILSVNGEASAGDQWTCRLISVAPGYAAAVVVAGRAVQWRKYRCATTRGV